MSALGSIISGVGSQVGAATTGAGGAPSDESTIAQNFQSFLTLLTTQLKNQNPMDPLDTNQFTQQLVQFAQVEQQIKSNQQLSTLVSMEKAAQSTYALAFVGSTVAVDGTTSELTNGEANWSFSVTKPANATITIKNSAGQLAYTGGFTIQPGTQSFSWDGRGNNGTQWPDGAYTISVTAKDTAGQTVAVATEMQGIVDSVDLTSDPPVLSIGGQNFGVDKIKRVVRPNAATTI